MKNSYQDFLDQKTIEDKPSGFRIADNKLNPMLFDFQKDIIKWALIRGRSACFADCGLGKTPIQLDWAKHVVNKTKNPVLIFAPLAVSKQTQREGEKFHIPVNICRKQSDIKKGINITNYEMLKAFEPDNLGGIVLDESSILKGFDGKFRKAITEFASQIPFRFACTATPAPNDLLEIINHAEFLGIMTEKEIKALFFTNRAQDMVQKWVLKGHAKKDFWKWLASWSVALRSPSDLGHDNDGFILPELKIIQKTIKATNKDIKPGELFATEARGLRNRQIARQNSIQSRTDLCSELVNKSNETWIIWCDLNKESNLLSKQINDSVEVKGSDPSKQKEKSLLDFQANKIKCLVTKPSIAGFGMSFQNCHNMAFVGLSDSYEKFYQAVRREWRFGQEHPVNAYLITTETEGGVVKNIKRKEKEGTLMFDELISNMNLSGQLETKREEMIYMEDIEKGKGWELQLGDSVLKMKNIETDSIGLSVFSPPFPGMYVYTNSKHDLGNTKTIEELIEQFRFVIDKDHLLRVTMPGRHCCVHLSQGVAFQSKDGYIGIKDFRGKVIQMMEEEGWIYYGEVCIDKNPQVVAIRTKDRGLLFKTLRTDASHLHTALADYLIQFRKPGDNVNPIKAGKDGERGWITQEEWIEWAAPVWYRQSPHYPGGIRQTDVLKNYRLAKDNKDEKHLAPLQLGVIERAIKLWSNPGDVIYDPFSGIGSTGYVALKLERQFKGSELKKGYFDVGIKNLKSVGKRNKGFNLAQAKG